MLIYLFRLAIAALLFAAPAFADEKPYLDAGQVDLVRLLPPPPMFGSPQAQAEMAEVVMLETTRTPERTRQAAADAKETVFDMFGATLGQAFAPSALPVAIKLFERLAQTEEEVTAPPKELFGRQRPFMANPALHPAAPRSKSGSYPSGHATRVTIIGIVLASMLPEQRAAIFARALDYAESRVIAGVHFRSDIVAGRQAGTAVDAVLFNDPAFLAEFGPARAEVRAALGLAP